MRSTLGSFWWLEHVSMRVIPLYHHPSVWNTLLHVSAHIEPIHFLRSSSNSVPLNCFQIPQHNIKCGLLLFFLHNQLAVYTFVFFQCIIKYPRAGSFVLLSVSLCPFYIILGTLTCAYFINSYGMIERGNDWMIFLKYRSSASSGLSPLQ